MKKVDKIAVYGKGGIGKSVVATGLSACYAMEGLRVLHVGCDPKADSAMRLVDEGQEVRTVLEVVGRNSATVAATDLLTRGRMGIDCCESGGPKPGLGCGGRGVARTLELMDEIDLFESGGYDVVVFDVLGDVVCGGFAAPLRRRFAEKIVVVTSEEPMAMFAANNVSRAVEVYAKNGVALAGLVANLRSEDTDRSNLERFASAMGTRILTYLPRDPRIQSAEVAHRTVVEVAPEAESSRALRDLAEKVRSCSVEALPPPTPMADEALFELLKGM